MKKVSKIYFILNFLFSLNLFAQSTDVFTSTGTTTWTVPPCVTTITVQVWGGGGGGGAVWTRFDPTSSGPTSNEACVTAGGGGGGGYARRVYAVTPGQVYTITVGSGGAGGTVNSSGNNRANAGSNGGNSTFTGPATAIPGILTGIGGSGGGAANFLRSCLGGCSGAVHQGANGNGGNGGSGANGSTIFNGGNGSAGVHAGNTQDRSGAGCGGAGTSANGGNANSTTGGIGGASDGGAGGAGIVQPFGNGFLGTNGNNGNTIGGGGGGAAGHNRSSNNNTHYSRIGGNGARGEVKISYQTGSSPGITSTNATSINCVSSSAQASITYTNTATTFNWSGPGILSGASTGTITVNAIGAYVYTASVSGCNFTGTINVVGNTNTVTISSTTASSLTCNTSTALASVTPVNTNTSVAWSGPGIVSGNNSATITVNAPGIYTYTVTQNTSLCTSVNTVAVTTNTIPPAATANTSSTLSCINTTATLTGGPSSGVTYSWFGPGLIGTSNNANASATLPGNYTLVTTSLLNGCTNSAVVTLTQNTAVPVVTSIVTNSLNCSITTASVIALTTTSPVTYTWLGTGILSGANSANATVNSGGTYNYSVTNNSNGCSSTGTVNVIQDSGGLIATASTTSSLTCNNTTVSLLGGPSSGVTYTWTGPGIVGNTNSQNAVANMSGNYTLSVSDISGCSNATILTVISNTVTPSISVGPTLTLSCSSPIATLNGSSGTAGVSFSWTGPITGSNPNSSSNDVSADGNYTLTITNPVNGCTNTAVQSVISNTASIPVTPLISATSTNLCAGQTATLSSSSLSNNVWSNGATTSSIVVNTSGIYSLYNTGTAGCNSGTTSISITISTQTIDVIVPQNIFICNGNTVSVPNFSSSVNGATFNWTNSNSSINLASSGAGTIPSFVGNNFGVNNLTGVISVTPTANGCSGSPGSFSITIYPNITVNAGVDYTVCYGQQYQINASPSGSTYSYSWTPSLFLSNSTISNPVASPTSDITYTLTVTDENGCKVNDVLNLFAGAPILTSISGATLCSGNSSVLTPAITGGNNQNYTYQWQPSTGLNNQSILNPIVSPSSTTVYTLTVSDGCSTASISQATVTVLSSPEIEIASTYTSGCAPLCVDLSNINNTNIVSWQWTVNGVIISNSQNPQYCFEDPGSYNIGLNVISVEGCSSIITRNNYIIVYPNPIADFLVPETISILSSDVKFIDKSVGATTWLWQFNDPFATNNNQTSTLQNPSHYYSNQGEYCIDLLVTNNFGCSDSTNKCIKIELEFTIYVPNAFTPDDDRINDIFTAVGINIIEFEMYIFDRWGEEIFYTNDINKGWNGKAKGGNLSAKQDVYIWKINARDIFNIDHFLTGHVTLIKKDN